MYEIYAFMLQVLHYMMIIYSAHKITAEKAFSSLFWTKIIIFMNIFICKLAITIDRKGKDHYQISEMRHTYQPQRKLNLHWCLHDTIWNIKPNSPV